MQINTLQLIEDLALPALPEGQVKYFRWAFQEVQAEMKELHTRCEELSKNQAQPEESEVLAVGD